MKPAVTIAGNGQGICPGRNVSEGKLSLLREYASRPSLSRFLVVQTDPEILHRPALLVYDTTQEFSATTQMELNVGLVFLQDHGVGEAETEVNG